MAQTWTISDKNYVMLAQFTNEDSNFISNDEHFISVDTPSSYYQFDCLINHELAKHIVVGNHVILRDKEGFIHDFTIRKVTTDINNVRMTVYAENGGMDLNNESAQPFTAPSEQKSLEWYLTQSGQPLYDSPIKLGLNELSDLKRVISNDSKETKLLQRLITTVNAFDGGEYRLYAKLANNNTTLPVLNLQLDIVKKLGSDISQTFLIDDYNLKELTNETSIVDLITAVFPRGKELDNGTTVDISSIVYDDGTYYTTKGSQYIKNRKAHSEWSYSRFSNDERWGYILGNFEYDTESPQELFNRALTYLKQHDSPTVAFSASGRDMNAKLGDTIMIATHKTPDPIYLRARVLQMKVSYVDDDKTEYILGNYAIQPSMVSQELLNLRNQIQDNKVGYVWLRYADDREGNGISEYPDGKSYLGIAYNMPYPEPSNNPDDYNWSLIKGNNGTDGTNGVGVQTSNVQYALGDSGTTAPTTAWTTTIPTLQDNKYLWTRTIVYYTNGTNTVSYSVSKKGDKGDKGNDGIAGKDGVGLKSTVVTYGLSDSELTQPTSWSTQVPTLIKGKYLWTKTVWTYTDDATETGYQKTYIARDGNDGNDGIPGKDGVGIASTTITYASSISGTTKPTDGWSATIPSVPSGQYLWTKTVWAYTDSTSETGYSVAKMGERGPQGEQGIQGTKGADGRSLYTWLKYADDANGNGMSETPDGKKYIGLAYNKTVSTESSNPSDYTWSLIQGENGAKGEDGKTYYTWVKYADTSTGGGLSDNPTGKKYIGLAYNKTTPTESTSPSDYTWALIKGDKGDKGDTGNGIATTTISYGVSSSGTTAPTSWGSTIPTVSPSNYLWTRTVITYTDNATTTSYSVGKMGEQGAKGDKGDTGATLYTWVKYADDSNGTGMSDYPSGKKYIGLAYNKPTATESSTASDYQWALIQGEKGIQGAKGDNGATLYTWVKYADTATGTGMSDSPTGKTYIGLAYNKPTATESSNPSDYTWSLIKGDKGEQGETGNGVSSTSVTYGVSNSGTIQPTSWGTSIPSVPNGQFLWTRTVMNYTNGTSTTFFSVAKMGETGARGSMGIAYLQPTAPTGNIETGSTWFKTVSNTDNRITSIYHYLSGSWVQNQFTQDAINVKSLSALSATLGNVTAGTITGSVFTNDFNRSYTSTLNRAGTTTLSDGKLRIDYKDVNKSTGAVSANGSYMEYSETGIDFAENDGTATGKRLELNSNRIALGSSSGAFHADPSKMTLSGDGYFKLQPKYFLGSPGNNNYQKMSWTDDGFELRPVDVNGNPRSWSTGIEIAGNNSYIDFKTPYNSSRDFDARIILNQDKSFQIENVTPDQPITFKLYNNLRVFTDNALVVRSRGDSSWRPVYASSFLQQSDEKWKYNIKDMPSRLEQFKNLDFKSYRLWAESGKYQEGIIANDNIELPFINKGYDGYAIDGYGYATFIGKATQEYIVQTDNTIDELKNENAEIKAENVKLKNKVDSLTTELETIKQQLSTLLNK